MRCDLTGKVSLVTGAARGIGQAIADRLAANGSRVVYTDLDAADPRDAAARGPGSLYLRMDVTRAEEVNAVLERVAAECGRLDVLVNNAGVVTLTRAMALELGPHGILVNAIAPGSTLTEGTRRLFYGEDGSFRHAVQRMLDHVPLGRPATTDEIAVAALFLADPENTYVTGHVLTVDGGWTAGYSRDF